MRQAYVSLPRDGLHYSHRLHADHLMETVMLEPRFTTKQTLIEGFVLFATLLALLACAVAWGVI